MECCKILLICSTFVTKSSKMCRLLAAIIFINITMGMGTKNAETRWGWGCYFVPTSLFKTDIYQQSLLILPSAYAAPSVKQNT